MVSSTITLSASTKNTSNQSRKPTLIIGVDPGTGSSSPTGFCILDPVNCSIVLGTNFLTKEKVLAHRIKDMSDQLSAELEILAPHYKLIVCIEQFVMRGKGGETLQRLIGSFMGRLPYEAQLVHVQNTTIKKHIAGHGHADKEAVAAGLHTFFKDCPDSLQLLKNLTQSAEFDILDAIAIGVTGWQMLPQK